MKIEKQIGLRIKCARLKKDMQISDLCLQLNYENRNISTRTIERYEAGHNTPKADLLIDLCKVLEVSPEYLLFGKEKYEESITWTDAFKNLNRLLTTLVVLPQKDNDPNSKTYGKYYFEAFDIETKMYLDKIFSYSENRNYLFEYLNNKMKFNLKDLDEIADGYKDLNEDLSDLETRIGKFLKIRNVDPLDFLNEKIKDIQSKRESKS